MNTSNLDKSNLSKSYDIDSHRRVNGTPAEWKVKERATFLSRLQAEGRTRLLEIGAGTGIDSLFFKENGLKVTCVDLSEEMVRYCRDRELDAHVMDFYCLDFADETFDAVYAMNCLLHVPKHEFDGVLQEIGRVLKSGALFFMGLYGGADSEGIWENDWCEPKRFFASYSDDALRQAVTKRFVDIDFHIVPLQEGQPYFQAFLVQKS
jgi:SAM-dependent methyltransferase